jgi:gamma-glutamyltranspeptidase/glutathione hydrolase
MQQGAWPLARRPTPMPPPAAQSPPKHSSGVVAVDRWGNVAALTHSINTVAWGSTGIFVGGVSIPDSASFQQEAVKHAGPGNRLPDAMAPLIVTRGGKPILASSAIGGGLHQRNIQILFHILELGLDAQAAVDAPAFLLPEWGAGPPVAQVVRGAFDGAILDGVRRLGQDLRVLKPPESVAFTGYWIGIQIDPASGGLQGAGTAELPSHALGF